MQELVGRLTALDPQASETLKVVSYFDALIAGDVSLETFVRGAAALSGVVAGLRHEGSIIRVHPDGTRADDEVGTEASWPQVDVVGGDVVWIERPGASHANDAMVLERFALAIAVSRARRRIAPEDSVHVLLSAERPSDERAAESARLGLAQRVRMVASAASGERDTAGPSTVVATPHGVLRATIVTAGGIAGAGVSGAGAWGAPDALPRSWAGAVLAYRLARRRGKPVDLEEFGVVGSAALALDGDVHPDVDALARLDARSARVLAALVDAESIRAAAVALGMHHSSVQTRHEALTAELGYDPRTPIGRARYELAEMLRALRDDAGF